MEEEGAFKKYAILAVVIILIAAAALYYFYYYGQEKEMGAVETAKDIIESVPEIQTNPVEDKTPALNPVERVNPFKYENPLR